MFEYSALHRAETDRATAAVEFATELLKVGRKTLRDTIIQTLGLNLIHPRAAKEREEEDGATVQVDEDLKEPLFVPASFIMGRPEAVNKYVEDYRAAENEDKAEADHGFDAWSRALQEKLESGDVGDLEPIIGDAEEEADPYKVWQSDSTQALLKAIGVKVEDKIANESADPQSEPSTGPHRRVTTRRI